MRHNLTSQPPGQPGGAVNTGRDELLNLGDGRSAPRPARAGRAAARSLAVGLGVAVLAFALTTSGSSAASAPTRCAVAQLSVKALGRRNVLAHIIASFAFVNQSRRPCTLIGYPHLQMLDAHGRPLTTIDRDYPARVTGVPRRLVTLEPGRSAYFRAQFGDGTGYTNLTCPTSARLLVRPPRSRRALQLAGMGARIAPYGGTRKHRCGLIDLTPVSAKRL